MHRIGPYSLTEFIDSGSFGDVYRCVNVLTGEQYACKIVDSNIKKDPKLMENFENELKIHAQMVHPGIIRLIDVQIDNQFIYIILEYSDSGNLEQLVQQNGPYEEPQAAYYFKQVLEAVAYIHQRGVAHRDITLKNILISQDGTAKLSDFGLCKHQPENTFLTTTCGTFVYVPPEILKQQHYDGLKADIWSAGICLYAMTSNHLPWIIDESTPPDKVWEETIKQICSGDIEYDEKQSEMLRDLLSQMLIIEPEYRADIQEILEHPWFSIAEPRPSPEVPEPDPNLINLVTSLINSLKSQHS